MRFITHKNEGKNPNDWFYFYTFLRKMQEFFQKKILKTISKLYTYFCFNS